MVKLSVSKFCNNKNFYIIGVSYIGKPQSNTAMFISKKVEYLLSALEQVNECLVFVEEGIEISYLLKEKHAFVFSSKPQRDYARFATIFAEERFREERNLKCCLTEKGFYLFEDSHFGENAYIEPGCIIGPDVTIGNNARIFAGCIIRRATIGDNFLANENAVIGANGFTMSEDEVGNRLRIPTLGRVIIGNNVEIGAHDSISCSTAGSTIIEDNVKLDALIYIGHDVHLHKNVEISAGADLGGFIEVGEKTIVGLGATVRNRIGLGKNSFVGMGSNVVKSVKEGIIVVGNPAKTLA